MQQLNIYSPEDTENGWRVDRKIPIAVILTMLIQTLAIVFWLGTLQQRVSHIESTIHSRSNLNNRTTALEVEVRSVKNILSNIDKKLDRVIFKK